MANSQTFTFNIKAVADMKDVQSNIQNIQNALKQLKLPNELQNSFRKTFGDLEKELDKYQKLMAGGFKTKGDATALEKSGNNIIRLYDEVVKKINSLDNSVLKKAFEDIGAKEVENLKQRIDDLQNSLKSSITTKFGSSFTDLKKSFKDLSTGAEDLDKELSKIGNSTLNTFVNNLSSGRLDLAEKNFDSLKERIKGITDQLSADKAEPINAWVQKIGDAFGNLKKDGDISPIVEQMNQLKQSLATAKADILQKLITSFNTGKISAEEFGQSIRQVMQADEELAHAQANVNKEIDQVKSRIQYFFGLSNAINLVKRAIRGAFETIKELDKAMTATAVVTDFSVGDMWEQLPEYTKRANELGVTTQAAYEAATLYYQQGLKTNEVNALSIETLKMARIAGLDAADATDRMTNALRGFNMELTQANAQRVDDVYSELAANTASNVDEISTAMTKVASLAHNANMEFETTAAFLSQIIETTRESAETAGTALKTVVARFSEVKKLVDEGQVRGTDEEGGVIDVNRVGAALRTAGIDLNKYFLGEVGLDDIFMELASKWDSLTSMQQRYIATQAAGSRQQSRFIALMQDYARTQELVGKAYNANGASAKQFAKTQESLESKLNRLKNAWNEFLMGLTNNVVVKGFVDLLTDLLNAINKVTSAFGEGAGSIAKWGLVLGGIAGGKALFKDKGLLDGILGMFIGGTGKTGGLLASLGKSAAAKGATGTGAAAAAGGAGKVGLASLIGSAGKDAWAASQLLGESVVAKLGGNAAGLSGMAAGLTGIATALGAVAAAVGIVVAGYQAWLRLTPEGHLKQAKAIAEAMNDVAASTQKAKQELQDAETNYKQYNDAVKNASNIEERSDAIKNRNEYITALVEQNEQLAKYVNTTKGEDGQFVLTINEEQLSLAVQKAADGAATAAIGASFAGALAAGKQADVYDARLRRAGVDLENRTIRGYDEFGNETTRALTDAEYAKFAQYAQAASNARMEQKAFAAQGYEQDFINKGLESDVADLLGNALANTFDEDQYLKDVNAAKQGWWIFGPSEANFREQYRNLYGVEADANMSKEALRRAVAEAEVTQTQSNKNQAVVDLFTGDNSALYKSILQIYNGIGDLATKSLAGINAESDTDIAKLLGLNPEDFSQGLEDLGKTVGYTEEELAAFKQQIQKNIKEQQKYQKTVVDRATRQMVANGEYTPQQMAQYLSLESFDDQQYIDQLLTQFKDSSFGNEIVSSVLGAMANGEWADSKLQEWINSIDFSNPIEAFEEINRGAKSLDPTIRGLAESIQQDGNFINEFSNSTQLSYFLLSESFEDLQEDLDKFVEENGEITASNVRDLADANKDLGLLLKNNIVSAKGLATVLNGIQNGTLNVTDLNDAIIAAANSMDNLDEIAKNTIDDLNGFDPGYDENDITGFITKVYENAKENFEKGAYGNNVMANYMKKIFGDFKYTGPEEGYGEAYKAWLQGNIAWLEANKDNMFSAWDDFVGEQNKRILESGEKTAEILEQNGEIVIHANGMTTQELIDAMAASGEMTAEQARMMITDFKNYSADFAHEMALNDLPNAIQAWYDALPKINGQKIFSETDFKTLSTLLGVSEKEIRDAIDNLKQDAGTLTAIDWTGGTGERSPEAYIKQLEALGATLKKTWFNDDTGMPETSNLFDFDEVRKSVQQAGIGEEFQYIFDGIVKESGSFTATIAGDLKTIEVKAGETATDAYNRVVQELADDRLAGKIGEQVASALADLENVEINFTPNTGEAEEAINTINDQLSETGEITVSPTIEADNTDALTKDEEVNTALTTTDGITATPVIDVSDGASTVISQVDTGLTNLNGKRATTYLDIISTLYSQAGARGGLVQSLAGGTGGPFLQPGFALTGEEGPEIIWNKNEGYAYVTGRNGAEFQNLQPGDRVFNAAETQRIFRNSSFATGGIFPSFATGYEGAKKPGSGRGGDSSDSNDSKKESTWRNELDWLYDLMEDIAEYEHQQTILQSKYDLALKDITQTGRDLYNLTKKELVNLETQLTAQQTVQVKRLQQMGELQTQVNAAGYGEYVQYNQKDKTLEIDWDAIEAIQDKDTYDEITDWISRMEEVQDQIEDVEEIIFDIKKQIQELQDRYLQSYLDFQNRVMDALVQQYQDQIDNLSTLNDTLNNTNNNILDSIQKEIDLERQIRDNTDTEKNIADIEARLAFLQRDTTGANAVEIKQLEKQLADARENYSDTLVDQAINRLSQSNEEAAQQREKQIELMQAQLDYWKESGALWNEVNSLIKGGFDGNGSIILGSDLTNLLKDADNWDAMSQAQRENWANELILDTNEVGAHIVTMTEEMNYQADKINSLLTSLTGKIGGTPEHSYTATKTEEKYATGGLNTYTGWAHLDGTPTEPEYVLNARQTDAFLRLADVLPNMMSSNTSTTNNLTNNPIFNISVNVDSISNDYDVDKLINRVKDDLADALSYRNVNALSFIR